MQKRSQRACGPDRQEWKRRCGNGKISSVDDAGAAAEKVLSGVGGRLRALRQARGVTLAQLSEATGISVSTLSRLESGLRRPSLELLLPLARVHHVQLDELVGAPLTGDPRIHPRPVVRNGMTLLPLTRRPGGIQAYKMLLPAGWPGREIERQVHEGYEWVYVLSGTVRLLLGEHDLLLSPGEAAEFDTRTPHGLSAPGPDAAELLCLMGRQGQRAHLRARPAGAGREDAGGR
jgi:transcriptional regulator with XRE-family HTH domain